MKISSSSSSSGNKSLHDIPLATGFTLTFTKLGIYISFILVSFQPKQLEMFGNVTHRAMERLITHAAVIHR